MSAALDRFMNNVRVRLPGALDDAVKLELFGVFDEFCKETNVWQETIPIEAVADQVEYELEPEENRALIVRLLCVSMDDTESTLGNYVAAWMPRPDLLAFQSAPSDGLVYRATVALTVVDPVSGGDGLPEVPDWFLTLYSQDITDGLLSRMMSQPAKPYFSQAGFLYHGRRFRNAISRARIAVESKNTYGTQNWQFPPFAQCRK